MFIADSLFTPCLIFEGRFFLFNLVPNARGAPGRAIRYWCIPNRSMILLRGLERLDLRRGVIQSNIRMLMIKLSIESILIDQDLRV
jgi:hypothetical protein